MSRYGNNATTRLALTITFMGRVLASSAGTAAINPPLTPAPLSEIIVCRPEVDPGSFAAEFHLTPRHLYHHALNGFAAAMDLDTLARIRADSRCSSVEADGRVVLCGQTIPTGILRMGITNFPVAHLNGVDERIDIDVGVLDTGIDLHHPDLNVYRGVDFTGSGLGGDDWQGHGTEMAGVIGALDNGIGVVGAAPGVRLWSLQVIGPDPADWANLIAALDYVMTNADKISVVNASIGSDGVTPAPSVAVRQAISNVVNLGVVFVAAAGNDSQDIFGTDGVFGTPDDIIPAAFPEVMTVSAMDDRDGAPGSDVIADFSNYSQRAVTNNPVSSPGAAIDVCAPGVGIYSTYPGTNYAYATGTSVSCAYASGLVALYIAANGRAHTAQQVYQIRQRIIDAAQPQTQWLTANTMDPDGNHEGLAIPSLSWVAPVKISSAQKTPGRFQFSFNTTPGYTYTVQYLNSLGLSNQWTNLATTNGIGITTNATVADPSLSASRFYRVARHPTP